MQQKDPYVLFEKRGLVYETLRPDQVWTAGDPHRGRRVGADGPPLMEIVVSASFVLPPLPRDPGLYNILTLARGRPSRPPNAPRFWNPARLENVFGGVYLYLTYDAARARFGVRRNAGSATPKLEGFFLEDLPPHGVTGRVLRALALVRGDVLYAGIEAEGASSELLQDGQAAGTGRPGRAWGAPATGHWWVISGVGEDDDVNSLGFPPGFGLSDLRVSLRYQADDEGAALPYSGALDHLISPPREEDPEVVLQEAAHRLASGLHRFSGEMTSLTGSAHALARQAEHLALELERR